MVRGFGIPIVFTLLGCAASIALAMLVIRGDRQVVEGRQQGALLEVRSELEQLMSECSLVLRALAREWEAGGRISEAQWMGQAEFLVENLPVLQAIEWADATGHVRYVMPLAGNEEAVGLNLLAEARRRRCLEQSRQNWQPTTSETLELVQGGLGFLVAVPVRMNGAFDGTMLGVYRVAPLLEKTLANIAPDHALMIHEGTRVIHARPSSGRTLTSSALEGTIDFSGTSWRVQVGPSALDSTTRRAWAPVVLGFLGVLLTLSLAHILRRRLLRAAELEHANRRLGDEIEQRLEAENALRTAQRQLEEESRSEVQSLAAELLVAEDRERKRIVEELHDGLGQLLSLAQIKLAELEASTTGTNRAQVHAVRDIIEEADLSARTLTFELSPPILYDLGLGPALEWLGEHMSSNYGLPVAIEVSAALPVLDEPLRVLLFRAIRELLANVVRHARAKRAGVEVRIVDGQLIAAVTDDGVAFDPGISDAESGLGLRIVRQRLRQLGGDVVIESRSGQGTRVVLSVPAPPGS